MAELDRWLGDLIDDFPRARYVVTSRPAAISEQWLEPYDFLASCLEPMSPADVTRFVCKWHEAVRSEIVDSEENAELTRCEARLHTTLASGRRQLQLTGRKDVLRVVLDHASSHEVKGTKR